MRFFLRFTSSLLFATGLLGMATCALAVIVRPDNGQEIRLHPEAARAEARKAIFDAGLCAYESGRLACYRRVGQGSTEVYRSLLKGRSGLRCLVSHDRELQAAEDAYAKAYYEVVASHFGAGEL